MRAPSLRAGGRKPFRAPRFTVAAFAGIAVALACPAPAAAHVAATPDTVAAGEPATISFRAPDERDDATTVRLEVLFPDQPAISGVTPENLPGWKISVHDRMTAEPAGGSDEMAGKPVASIVWEGGTVPVGTFQEFPVRIGKLPASGTLAFQALQTYSDGQVVRWADPARPGQPEPEHPAPVVTVTPVAVDEASDPDVPARALGGAALGVAVLAVGVAWLRKRPGGGRAEAADEAAEREKARL
ncbi:YcnI family protein [Amycolatopsis mongoliensis]|uniref:YcnI family protein n=1 Tax=Amycolatopsis mongoliensis TaxID=715475 RepID=A0A9Y2JK35_9PSEU|nr:YcnI family protein [Amycolatopsis sp. 4-36]WIX98851.1 YcnI family protein [Amycolatopsis sp. 4-36]